MKDMDTADAVSPYLKLPLRAINAVRLALARSRQRVVMVRPEAVEPHPGNEVRGRVPE
jgi:hypothetical protein